MGLITLVGFVVLYMLTVLGVSTLLSIPVYLVRRYPVSHHIFGQKLGTVLISSTLAGVCVHNSCSDFKSLGWNEVPEWRSAVWTLDSGLRRLFLKLAPSNFHESHQLLTSRNYSSKVPLLMDSSVDSQ